MLHKQPGKERLTVYIIANIEAIATLPGYDFKYIKFSGKQAHPKDMGKNIFRCSIPLPIIWCIAPEASVLAWRGMPASYETVS
jgi:hypothetical protein